MITDEQIKKDERDLHNLLWERSDLVGVQSGSETAELRRICIKNSHYIDELKDARAKLDIARKALKYLSEYDACGTERSLIARDELEKIK